jgi:hypothetical protein
MLMFAVISVLAAYDLLHVGEPLMRVLDVALAGPGGILVGVHLSNRHNHAQTVHSRDHLNAS